MPPLVVARPFRRARKVNGEGTSFPSLDRWGELAPSRPPADPLPPKRVESQLDGRPVSHAHRFPVFVCGSSRAPSQKIHRRRFYGHFAGGSPGAASCDVLLDPCVTSRVVSRLLKARGVPSIFAKVQATQLFCADSW